MASRWSVFSGLALLSGAALFGVKSVVILATGYQPPFFFVLAPLFFALGVVALAPALQLQDARRRVVPALGVVSLVSAGIALITELTGELFGAALAVATLTAIAGALIGGWRPGADQAKRALVLVAAVVVPAIVVGGILAELNERLLEIGLLDFATAWAVAGVALVRRSATEPIPGATAP